MDGSIDLPVCPRPSTTAHFYFIIIYLPVKIGSIYQKHIHCFLQSRFGQSGMCSLMASTFRGTCFPAAEKIILPLSASFFGALLQSMLIQIRFCFLPTSGIRVPFCCEILIQSEELVELQLITSLLFKYISIKYFLSNHE